jgi:ABC-2 type transport system permease protein
MRKALLVAGREYGATVRTKGFVLGLILAPLVMGGSGIGMALLSDRVDIRERRIALLDHSGIVTDALVRAADRRNATTLLDPETGEQVQPAYTFEIVEIDPSDPLAQRLELSDRVRRDDLHAFVEVGPGVLHPRESPGEAQVSYHSESPAIDPVREWLARPLNDELRRLRLQDAGVEQEAVQDLFDWIPAQALGLASADPETGEVQDAERTSELEALLAPIVMAMMMFLMLMMGAMPLLNAVMEEKAQRIAEVMLGSVKPFDFMLGKLLGGVGVALTAAVAYVCLGAWGIRHWEAQRFVPVEVIPWFFAYMVLAILMMGALLAALGSACNDAAEAQSVQFPAMLPIMIPMFVMLPVIMNPDTGFSTGISLFPLFAPVLMILRLSAPGGVPLWQAWVGLAGVGLFALLFVWLGGRIFRVGLLMQGTPPKLKNLLQWALRG